jgi:hypothetical protein
VVKHAALHNLAPVVVHLHDLRARGLEGEEAKMARKARTCSIAHAQQAAARMRARKRRPRTSILLQYSSTNEPTA